MRCLRAGIRIGDRGDATAHTIRMHVLHLLLHSPLGLVAP